MRSRNSNGLCASDIKEQKSCYHCHLVSVGYLILFRRTAAFDLCHDGPQTPNYRSIVESTRVKPLKTSLRRPAVRPTTLCLKKVPTFELSATLSNFNRFSNFCTAGKRIKFATKPVRHYPPHLRNVATLPWEIKKSIFANIQQILKLSLIHI